MSSVKLSQLAARPQLVSRSLCALALALLGLSHAVAPMAAQTAIAWNNAGGTTDFNTATNWTGNTLPGTTSIATFTGAAVVQPNVSANISISGLNFSTSLSSGYTLSATGGAAISLLSTSQTSGLAAITSANSTGTNLISAPLVLAAGSGAGQYILQTGAGTLSLAGVISAAGSNPLALSTAGTVTLSGTNTYTGGTLVFGTGSVSVASIGISGSAGNLGTGGTIQLGIVSNAGNLLYTGAGETTNRTVDLSGTTGGASITSSGSGALIFSGNLTTSGAGSKTLTLSGTNTGANALQGAVVNGSSGTTAVAKTGTGNWTLSGTNTYTGGTAIDAGTLTLGSATGFGSSGTISFGGGTLQHGTGITTDLSARFSNAASQAYKIDTNGNSVTYATALTSTGGSLTKSGTGTLSLTGANTFDGGTTINSGTLTLGASGALASGGNVVVNSNLASTAATLSLGAGFSQTIGALTIGGTGS